MLNVLRAPAVRATRAIGTLAAAAAFTLVASGALTAQVRINLKAWQEPVLMDTLRQDHFLRAPADKVYQAALQVFADLGIPTGQTDGKNGIIGSEKFERARVLANAPMSHWFLCGEGAMGANADIFRLEIAVVAWVKPEGAGTTLGVAAIASGRDVSGVFRNPKECQSNGALEVKIYDKIVSLVGGR
ncbi:MAG: hypothetical protein ABI442_19710 [Gemmatimonadaceae bacterium]